MKISKKSALLVIDIQQEDFKEMTPENKGHRNGTASAMQNEF